MGFCWPFPFPAFFFWATFVVRVLGVLGGNIMGTLVWDIILIGALYFVLSLLHRRRLGVQFHSYRITAFSSLISLLEPARPVAISYSSPPYLRFPFHTWRELACLHALLSGLSETCTCLRTKLCGYEPLLVEIEKLRGGRTMLSGGISGRPSIPSGLSSWWGGVLARGVACRQRVTGIAEWRGRHFPLLLATFT